LGKSHDGGGFANLTGGMNDKVVFLVDQLLYFGQPSSGRNHIVVILATGASGVEVTGHYN
jgi:hypothetical protein